MFTLNRTERLKSYKLIQRIFNREGQSFAAYPIRIIWLETPLESPSPVQVAFSVPKRNFKKAVSRNRIRRQMKEIYRLNKPKLYEVLEEKKKTVAVMFVFIGKEALSYSELEKSMEKVFYRFYKKV